MNYSLAEDIIFQEVGGEVILLTLASGEYHGLNEVGSFIFKHISEGKNEKETLRSLVQEFDVDEKSGAQDLSELLSQLIEKGILKPD